jgi:hypothetical protein
LDLTVLIPVCIVAIILIFYFSVHHERKRTEALQQNAPVRGFFFTPKSDLGILPSDTADLHLFKHGHSQRVSNILQKPGDPLSEMIFDYIYVTGSGRNRSTHKQTVFLFQTSRHQFPEFELRPEHLFHKIGQAFGYQDIDFEAHPEFSKRYILRGKNEAMIRKTLTPDLIAAFENEKGISAECAGHFLIVYYGGKRIAPDQIYEVHDRIQRIYLTLSKRSEFI